MMCSEDHLTVSKERKRIRLSSYPGGLSSTQRNLLTYFCEFTAYIFLFLLEFTNQQEKKEINLNVYFGGVINVFLRG